MEISKRIYNEKTNAEYYIIKWEILNIKDIPFKLYKEIEELIFEKILENNKNQI